ncbi:MAG TPA: exodeoxyribonuclease VII small subunit [Alphaproteobacteria bacterium]|nr:exodeoxyribonuclease VII small subunit [Alphaproteobacteria bacterium]
MAAEDSKETSFEQALGQLEGIVRELESGRGELDNSIKNYEQGMKLLKICEEKLSQAKLKVEKITSGTAQEVKTEEFEG